MSGGDEEPTPKQPSTGGDDDPDLMADERHAALVTDHRPNAKEDGKGHRISGHEEQGADRMHPLMMPESIQGGDPHLDASGLIRSQ